LPDTLDKPKRPSAPLLTGEYAPDRHRMQLFWLAFALIGFLTLALVLLVAYGLDITNSDYTEPLLLIGLLAFVTCAVAYFADKEREQRAENRRLIRSLHETAHALDVRVARLNKLSETSAGLAGALDLERISELVVQALAEQVQADAASLVLMDKAKGEYLHTRRVGTLPGREGDSSDPVTIAKAATEATASPREAAAGITEQLQAWEKVRATISAPVKVSEVIGGALAAIRSGDFDTEDQNLLTTLASMASKAIESAELHQRLRQSYYRTLHVLARSLAARDPYTASHGEAVTRLACCLATHIGMPQETIEAVRAYGPLHDLGKIGIPDSVLSKQGPLTYEEYEMVRQHTVIGESIIAPLEPGSDALAMMRSHHERWDGGGYPDGVAGEQIPLPARVMAVADAFHAIVSHRSYRGGAIPFQAIQELKSGAGSQFDPVMVDELVALWDNGELAEFTIWTVQPAQPRTIFDVPSSVPTPGPRSAAAPD
jgi:HD-GYP domain-containing protein (c-di-GMP phosphodiesterase class II)